MFEPRCHVCKIIKEEMLAGGKSPTQTRIYNCRKFNKNGETQTAISKSLGVSLIGLNKHINNHQNPNDTILVSRKFNRELEQQKVDHNKIRFEIAEAGLKDLQDGKMKITSNTLARVAKDQVDYEDKVQNRQIKVLEMIYSFMSGEKNGELPNGELPVGDTDRLTEGDTEGEAR